MDHQWIIRGLMTLLCTLLPLSAHARTYYVHHTTGNNTNNDCTEAQNSGTPKQTVTAAFACLGLAEGAGAGHTVVVLTPAGNVNEALINNWPGGTAVAPFTLKNGNGGVGATFRPTASGNGVFDARNPNTLNAHYIVIDGLSVDGTFRGGALVSFNSNGSHHNTIKNGEVKNGRGRACIMSGGSSGGGFNTIENMHVHHCGQEKNVDHGIYIANSNNVVKDSIIHDTCARGIKIDAVDSPVEASNNKLLNNVVYRAGHYNPVGVGDTLNCTQGRNGILVRGLKNEVSGNLVYESIDEGIRLFGNPGRVEDTYVYNNTIVSNGIRGLRIESGTRHVVKNNLLLGNTNNNIEFETGAAAVLGNNTTVGTLTDFFVSPGTDNYLLKSGSPAINAGTASICTTTQRDNGVCWQAKTLSGFSGAAPDLGYAEFESGGPPPPLVARYGFNTVATDGGTLANHCTETDVSYTASEGLFIEGSHAAALLQSTDALECPHAGLTTPTTFNLRLSVYPTDLTGTHYWFSHVLESPTRERIYIYTSGTQLRLGLGDNNNIPIMTVATGQYYRALLVVNGSQWAFHVDGVLKSSGTVTGLTTLAPTYCLGQFCGATRTTSVLGRIDIVEVYNTVPTQAEIDADCALYCVAAPPPPTCPPACTYSPLDLVFPGSLSVDGTMATFTLENITDDGVNPGICNDLTNFAMSGATIVGCSLTPTTLVLTRAAPPASGAEVITLTVTSPSQSGGVTNNFVPPPTGGADLAMTGYRCRPDVGSNTEPYIGAINTECRIPYQGGTTLYVSIENSGSAAAPEQGYALKCIRDPDGTPSAELRVTEDCSGTLGLCLNPLGTGLPHGAGAAQSLPVGAGITYQAGGYLIRRDLPADPIVIGIDQQVEFGFALTMDTSIAILQEWSCLVGVDTGIALDGGSPARLKVRAPRVSRR